MYKPGAIEVYGEADWKLGSIPELVEAPHTFFEKTIQYNQLDTGSTDCTIYASMGAVSDLTGKVWTLEERRKIHNLAISEGLDPASGRWLHKAVDLIRRNSENISSLRVDLDSKDLREVLELGYTVITGYKGNRQYNEDAEDNCVVETAEIGSGTYGHCIRITLVKDKVYVVDNYLDVKTCNVYRHAVFKEQIANGVFFHNGYIYFETIPMPINLLPVHIKAANNPKYYNEILAWEKECGDLWDEGFRPKYSNYIDGDAEIIANKMLNDLMLVRTGLWKLTPKIIDNVVKIMGDQRVADMLYSIGQKFDD